MPLYDILNEFQKGHSHIAVVYRDSKDTLQKTKEGITIYILHSDVEQILYYFDPTFDKTKQFLRIKHDMSFEAPRFLQFSLLDWLLDINTFSYSNSTVTPILVFMPNLYDFQLVCEIT